MKTKTLSQRLHHVAALGTGLLMAALVPGTASALITGSGHDLSGVGASTGNDQICIYCHTPHNADTTITDAPLWNHEIDTSTSYTVYTGPSGTMDATTGQPSGISKLCLSCHDGTVAIDSYGGMTGSTLIQSVNANANFGTDLSNDHPISFTYDTLLTNTDAELWDPASHTVIVGSGSFVQGPDTIANVLLFNDSVECASCHDVHNTQISTENIYMLRDNMAGSELCLNCHNK